ncbi:MAG: hydantoinase/oxoprolinase family protein, partial [Gammaproteobacteria bacterium]|nr:hydantoinase/oxoprolinase family protein [Gammaproteobacteria bacterium]
GLELEAVAAGIIDIANERLARALRVISVQRGVDPRALALVSFGGAGGLHVCALAESLGMQRALIPVNSGVLSAMGMLVAPRSRQLSHTHIAPLARMAESDIEQALARLGRHGAEALQQEGVDAGAIRQTPTLDLRYRGQSYSLNLPWQGSVEQAIEAYHRLHRERYGHAMNELEVELVNLRQRVEGPDSSIPLQALTDASGESNPRWVRLYGIDQEVAVYARDSLIAGQHINGPALITETVSTSLIAEGWQCTVDESGALLLSRV